MSFKLIVRNTVSVPVKGVISDEAGKPERFEFRLQCRRMGADDLKATISKDSERSVIDFMADVVQGWSGVMDDSGAAVPFDDDAARRLFDIAGVANLAFSSYLAENGAKEKN